MKGIPFVAYSKINMVHFEELLHLKDLHFFINVLSILYTPSSAIYPVVKYYPKHVYSEINIVGYIQWALLTCEHAQVCSRVSFISVKNIFFVFTEDTLS